MSIFAAIEAYLASIAGKVPMETFAFAGSVVEEVIAPIPSLLVPATVGTLAKANGSTFVYLIVLSAIAAAGKTLGATFIYLLADWFEDFVIGRFGKYLGITHKEIEGIGKYFSGGFRDFFVLLFLRLIPAMPSTPISFGAGVIKVHLWHYVTASFLGSFVRDFIVIYLGYEGLTALQSFREGFDSAETILKALVVLAIAGVIAWFYWLRQHGKKPKILEKIEGQETEDA